MPAVGPMRFGRYDYAAFLSFLAYAAGSVIVPVSLVTIAMDLDFPLDAGGLAAGGTLQLGRTIPMLLAMLLCGFAAGRWGKRRALGWSVLVMAAGVAVCAVAPAYGTLFLGLAIAGLGDGVLDGLATPFVRDLHPEESGRYINFSHAFWSIGVMVTVLLAGWLLTIGVSWRLIVGTCAALALIPAAMILAKPKPGGEYPEHPEPLHWAAISRQSMGIARKPRFWLFFTAMFFAGGGEYCLTFWCASYVQMEFSTEAWAGGVGTAIFAGGMVLGRTMWAWLIPQSRLGHLVVCSAVIGTLTTVFFPTVSNLWGFFGLLFLTGVATAPFWPSIQSYSADRLPGTDTTMLFILLSCAGIPGCGFLVWLMGWLGSKTNALDTAFYLVPACFLSLGGLIAVEMLIGRGARSKRVT